MQEVNPNSPVRGTLLYMHRRYFAFHKIGAALAGAPAAVYYNWAAGSGVFGARFSRDGRTLLLRYGEADEWTGSFTPLLWYLDGRVVIRPFPPGMSYPSLLWSPDANYIAYFGDADADYNVHDPAFGLTLHIADLRTGADREITQNPGVTYASWTEQGTLLFTALKSQEPGTIPGAARPGTAEGDTPWDAEAKRETRERRKAKFAAQPKLQPGIYEVAPAGGKPRLVIEDGYEPLPSPDGRWIVFYGEPNDPRKGARPSKARSEGEGKGVDSIKKGWERTLYLFDVKKGTRTLLRSRKPLFLKWTPDSRRLLLADSTHNVYKDGRRSDVTLHIGSLAVGNSGAARRENNIATLTVPGPATSTSSSAFPYFTPMSATRDGRFLLLKVVEPVTYENDETFVTSLQAVSLSGGGISSVMRFKPRTVIDLDWHDESGT